MQFLPLGVVQQSNQGYGELKGVEEVQKYVKQKYSTELIWRTVTLKSLKSADLEAPYNTS